MTSKPNKPLPLGARKPKSAKRTARNLQVHKSLPDLSGSQCTFLCICGQASLESGERWPKDDVERTYLVNTPKGKAFLRLLIEDETMYHCHIDLASPGYFSPDEEPETEVELKHFLLDLQALSGIVFDVRITAYFAVEPAQLPPVVKSLQAVAKWEDHGIKAELAEGTLRFEGSPLAGMTWKVSNDGGMAELKLRSLGKLTMSEDYIREAFELTKSSYQALYIGKGG